MNEILNGEKQILVEIIDLHKSYYHHGNELKILKGINFTIYRGETVAITGESGVGKSTFLHILGTIDTPSSGKILFQGNDIFKFNEEELSRFRNRSIGFVFQFHYLISEMTALENVMVPCMIYGEKYEVAKSKALNILKRVGLGERLTHNPSELSGGEQQRVALARALVMEPLLVLADEPTGNLDEVTSESVHNLIVELNRETGITFVIATHNLKFAQMMHRVFEIKNGVFNRLK